MSGRRLRIRSRFQADALEQKRSVVAVVNRRFRRLNVSVNQRAELIRVPMFSCGPPCLEAGIRYSVGDCALISPPQSIVERSIQHA